MLNHHQTIGNLTWSGYRLLCIHLIFVLLGLLILRLVLVILTLLLPAVLLIARIKDSLFLAAVSASRCRPRPRPTCSAYVVFCAGRQILRHQNRPPPQWACHQPAGPRPSQRTSDNTSLLREPP